MLNSAFVVHPSIVGTRCCVPKKFKNRCGIKSMKSSIWKELKRNFFLRHCSLAKTSSQWNMTCCPHSCICWSFLRQLMDEQVLCVHGGLSPDIKTLDQIRTIERNQEIPHKGAFCDLVWSDPEDVDTWAISPRGAGWLFGAKVTNEVDCCCFYYH